MSISEMGLIPAHAGKTHLWWTCSLSAGAHPRSRGENPSMIAFTVGAAGSSPLTRGKRPEFGDARAEGGLIPAHAGKTR